MLAVMPKASLRSSTRERILDASLDLFAEQGFSGTTISDVERRVGLAAGTGSFYRHFPSKQALLDAAVNREVELRLEESRVERAALQGTSETLPEFSVQAAQILRDLRRFDRLLRLSLHEGERVPEVRDAIGAALRSTGADAWIDDPVATVSVAALLGFHLFGMLGRDGFQAMSEQSFVAALSGLVEPPVRSVGGNRKSIR